MSKFEKEFISYQAVENIRNPRRRAGYDPDHPEICLKGESYDIKAMEAIVDGWMAMDPPILQHVKLSLERGGEEGAFHWQGCFQLKQALLNPDTDKEYTHPELKRLLMPNAAKGPKTGGGITKCRAKAKGGYAGACAYVEKKEGHVFGPIERGTIVVHNQGARNDLQSIKDAMDAGADAATLWQTHFNEMVKYPNLLDRYTGTKLKRRQKPVVICFWGASGVGKTRRVYDAEDFEDIVSIALGTNNNVWFSEYNTQPAVLFDDINGKMFRYKHLLALLGDRNTTVPVHGFQRPWHPSRIYMTSDQHPSTWYDHRKDGDCEQLLRRIDYIYHCEDGKLPTLEKVQRKAVLPYARMTVPKEWGITKRDPLAVRAAKISQRVAEIQEERGDKTEDDDESPSSPLEEKKEAKPSGFGSLNLVPMKTPQFNMGDITSTDRRAVSNIRTQFADIANEVANGKYVHAQLARSMETE